MLVQKSASSPSPLLLGNWNNWQSRSYWIKIRNQFLFDRRFNRVINQYKVYQTYNIVCPVYTWFQPMRVMALKDCRGAASSDDFGPWTRVEAHFPSGDLCVSHALRHFLFSAFQNITQTHLDPLSKKHKR